LIVVNFNLDNADRLVLFDDMKRFSNARNFLSAKFGSNTDDYVVEFQINDMTIAEAFSWDLFLNLCSSNQIISGVKIKYYDTTQFFNVKDMKRVGTVRAFLLANFGTDVIGNREFYINNSMITDLMTWSNFLSLSNSHAVSILVTIMHDGGRLPVDYKVMKSYPSVLRFLRAHFPAKNDGIYEFYIKDTAITENMAWELFFNLSASDPVSVKDPGLFQFQIVKVSGTELEVLQRVKLVASKIRNRDLEHLVNIAKFISGLHEADDAPFPFCFITGPTGSGKTLLSFALERNFGCIRFNMSFFSAIEVIEKTPIYHKQNVYMEAMDISKELFTCLQEDLQ
jgi:hypothetical protein